MPDTTDFNSFNSQSSTCDDAGAFLKALGKRLSEPAESHPARMTNADRADYLAMLRGDHPADAPNALSDEQAHKLIDTLWSIMVAFVDLGFGIGNPCDGANNAAYIASPCGQVGADTSGKCDKRAADPVNSPHSETDCNKNKPAPCTAAGESEGA